jgi:hypothetical protein
LRAYVLDGSLQHGYAVGAQANFPCDLAQDVFVRRLPHQAQRLLDAVF